MTQDSRMAPIKTFPTRQAALDAVFDTPGWNHTRPVQAVLVWNPRGPSAYTAMIDGKHFLREGGGFH